MSKTIEPFSEDEIAEMKETLRKGPTSEELERLLLACDNVLCAFQCAYKDNGQPYTAEDESEALDALDDVFTESRAFLAFSLLRFNEIDSKK